MMTITDVLHNIRLMEDYLDIAKRKYVSHRNSFKYWEKKTSKYPIFTPKYNEALDKVHMYYKMCLEDTMEIEKLRLELDEWRRKRFEVYQRDRIQPRGYEEDYEIVEKIMMGEILRATKF